MPTDTYKSFKEKVSEENYKRDIEAVSGDIQKLKEIVKDKLKEWEDFNILNQQQKNVIVKFLDFYIDKIVPFYPDDKLVKAIYLAGKRLLTNGILDVVILNIYNRIKPLLPPVESINLRVETDLLAILRPYTLLSINAEKKISKINNNLFSPSIKPTVIEKFKKAKDEHINTKNKVIRYVFDNLESIKIKRASRYVFDNLESIKIKRASECQFIKILDEVDIIKDMPVYKEIVTTHSKFHEYVNFIILNQKTFTSSQKYLLVKEIESISLKLLYLLNELQIDISQSTSFIDNLTESYNKNVFNLIFFQEVKRAQRYEFPLSIMMIDIDNFKKINDTYGHLVGDEVLKELSRVIRKSIRKTDYLFRFGGEEFLILLPHTSIENAFKVGEKIRKKVEETIFSNEHLKITVSCGLSEVKNFDNTYLDIEEADKMLYVSKNSGKNRCTAAR
ncbi:MAG: GGDEF domain-containing protein [Hydrogenothermaceae bacterium]|nr:GGDEF domain-containing protein [Hydrogenothermaceae bacterium]